MMGQVAITGAGAVTPLGVTLQATREGVERGVSALDVCRRIDASLYAESRAGEVRGFDARAHYTATKALKLADRATRFAVAAAGMALADAAWPADRRENLGVLIGCAGHDTQDEAIAAALAPDPDHRSVHDVPFLSSRLLDGLTPLWLLTMLPNMASSHVAIQLGATGPNSTVMSDAAAGIHAIGEACDWIAGGQAGAMLAGGSDCPLTPHTYAALQQSGAFERGALPPAEGAAVFLLEAADAARARGARVQAVITAYATRTGACGLSRAIADVLQQNGWRASDVDLLCLGGAGDVSGFPDVVRRLDSASLIGAAGAAGAPIDLAVALDGRRGRHVLCVAHSSSGPAAALTIVVEGERP